jgi:hypothetical protein
VYEDIKSLRPHFHSLREVQGNVSLDIKLPLTWQHEEIVKPYRTITVKMQDKNDKFTLVSLIASATQEGYDIVFACANDIFKVNREEEEKRKLFDEKVRESQKLFKTESLDKLKEINLIDNYGQEDTTGIGDLEEGDGEGQDGDSEPQEPDDTTVKKD